MFQLPVAKVERTAAMRQPAHDQLVAPQKLHAVNAEILPFFVRAARNDQRPGNQRCGISGPAGLDGQERQIDVIFLDHHVLARCVSFDVRSNIEYLLPGGKILPEIAPAFWWIRFFQEGHQLADIPKPLGVLLPHGQRDAPRIAKQIAQQWNR